MCFLMAFPYIICCCWSLLPSCPSSSCHPYTLPSPVTRFMFAGHIFTSSQSSKPHVFSPSPPFSFPQPCSCPHLHVCIVVKHWSPHMKENMPGCVTHVSHAIFIQLSSPQNMMLFDSHCCVRRKDFMNIKHLDGSQYQRSGYRYLLTDQQPQKVILWLFLTTNDFIKKTIISYILFSKFSIFISLIFSVCSQTTGLSVDLGIYLEGNIGSLEKFFLGMEKCLVVEDLQSVSTTHIKISW